MNGLAQVHSYWIIKSEASCDAGHLGPDSGGVSLGVVMIGSIDVRCMAVVINACLAFDPGLTAARRSISIPRYGIITLNWVPAVGSQSAPGWGGRHALQRLSVTDWGGYGSEQSLWAVAGQYL